MSQFGLAFYLYAKNFQNLWEIGWLVRLFISMSRRSAIVSPASERVSVMVWAHRNSEQRWSCVGVCVCANVRVRTSVHAYVRDVFAIYDDNILSRLIMIIIKIIILYFIQIRHTDYFPSAGIPASCYNSCNCIKLYLLLCCDCYYYCYNYYYCYYYYYYYYYYCQIGYIYI